MRQIKDTQYVIDEYGNVFNTKRGTKCTPWKENNTGYWLVRLYKNGKETCYRVHRLVAEAYLPNPYGFKFVKHKGDNKDNNHVTNLEWGANSDNVKEGYENGCYLHKSRSYRISITDTVNNLTSYFPSMREAETQTGINRKTISAVLKGKRNNPEGLIIAYEG